MALSDGHGYVRFMNIVSFFIGQETSNFSMGPYIDQSNYFEETYLQVRSFATGATMRQRVKSVRARDRQT